MTEYLNYLLGFDNDNLQPHQMAARAGYSGDTDPPTGHTDPPMGFWLLKLIA